MEPDKEIKPQAVIVIPDHGPLKITGNFVVTDLKRDKKESPPEIELCTCGKSSNKPYCDDSHKK